MLTPICVFTYNRLNETKQMLEALQKNYLAPESELFIFSDGPKNEKDKIVINEVRQYIQSVKGFKSVEVLNSTVNKGLASSIIHGVSFILKRYEKVIVMEDDLIASQNFLNFMNQALDFYQNDQRIQSINGYSMKLKNKNHEVYFLMRTESWGWATWRNRWDPAIFDKNYLKEIIQTKPSILKEFKKKCGADIPKMLLDSINNKNDSWYVRWAFDHFKNNHYAVFPTYSFISNIGYGENATHCKGINSYTSDPVNNDKTVFDFPNFHPMDRRSNREFLSYFSIKHKIIIRIKLLKTREGRTELYKEIKMRLGLN
jgi:hypothetical protein